MDNNNPDQQKNTQPFFSLPQEQQPMQEQFQEPQQQPMIHQQQMQLAEFQYLQLQSEQQQFQEPQQQQESTIQPQQMQFAEQLQYLQQQQSEQQQLEQQQRQLQFERLLIHPNPQQLQYLQHQQSEQQQLEQQQRQLQFERLMIHPNPQQLHELIQQQELISQHQNQRLVQQRQWQAGILSNYPHSLPHGYRFCPTDQVLITHYLKPRINKEELPLNLIHDVNIYDYHPSELTEKYTWSRVHTDSKWYFFTSRNKKYPKGGRPDRKAKKGYWKPTTSETQIQSSEGHVIGFKRVLDYYEGTQKDGVRTKWKMHEYGLPKTDSAHSSRTANDENNMQLDEAVLCKIYSKKSNKKDNAQKDARDSKSNNASRGLHNLQINEAAATVQNPNNNLVISPAQNGDSFASQVSYESRFPFDQFGYPHCNNVSNLSFGNYYNPFPSTSSTSMEPMIQDLQQGFSEQNLIDQNLDLFYLEENVGIDIPAAPSSDDPQVQDQDMDESPK